mmetsp:Transcript_32700/g.75059  ORF Transcript_32700/g.75059 Transcript_32700/m.75059 type:complete len:234 (-) Transcript_32700:97-798(-)
MCNRCTSMLSSVFSAPAARAGWCTAASLGLEALVEAALGPFPLPTPVGSLAFATTASSAAPPASSPSRMERGESGSSTEGAAERATEKSSSISCCRSLRDTSCRWASRRCCRLSCRMHAFCFRSCSDVRVRVRCFGLVASSCLLACSNSLRKSAIACACCSEGQAVGSSGFRRGGGIALVSRASPAPVLYSDAVECVSFASTPTAATAASATATAACAFACATSSALALSSAV